MSKALYIIAGCNGAGKTTASYTMLPEIWKCREFVNADEIARGLSPFNPESVAIEAGRLMLKRIDMLLQGEESFSIETTLATRSYVKLIERAHEHGFDVNLLFFWLETPEAAIRRVAQRVSEGGHNIPTDTIVRRYHLGINNFFKLFKDKVDCWTLVDNNRTPRKIVADNNKTYNEELIRGLELAEYRMLRDKAMRNQIVITNFEDSGLREIPARELFVKLYNEPVPQF